MTDNQIYRKFNRQAIAKGLSGKEMQCWLLLYELLEAKQRQDVCFHTAMLLSMLEVSRSQFFRIRQELEQQGFLQIKISEDKRIYYTLLLEGELVKLAANSSNKVGRHDHMPLLAQSTNSTNLVGEPIRLSQVYQGVADITVNSSNKVGRHDHMPPLAQSANIPTSFRPSAPETTPHYPSGDLILTNRYEQLLRNFVAAYENNLELWGALKNWAELRKKNGWTLTGWGLQELLHKLADLGKGCAATMTAIVRRAVEKRWKGFYTLRVDSKPSGEALRKQERREEWLDAMRRKTQQVTHKFKNENRDLSVFEQ